MTESIQHLVRVTDAALARMYLSVCRERNALLVFMFHSLFRDEREMSLNLIDPLQRTTVRQFREFVEYYLDNGYRFITPEHLLRGLPDDQKYALITFDDGYVNNRLALPILESHGVPATFFITTDNVLQNRCFWWDVLYRERSAQSMPEREVYQEALSMKSLRTEEIEERLIDRYGDDAFRPRGDIDRPFSPDELREFSRSPLVHLGNHTSHHGILINYTPDEARQQLQRAQDALRGITGVEPVSVAYPNGGVNESVVDASRAVGLKVGFTIRPEKNRLPLNASSPGLLRLGRFSTHSTGGIEAQCRTFRSDVVVYGLLRDAYLHLARKQIAS